MIQPEQFNKATVEYWNDPAVVADLVAVTPGVSKFAKDVEADLPRNSSVLELGCGAGDDAAYFASMGHDVIALDVSAPLIDLAAERFADLANIDFRRADIARPLEVGDSSCDVVFSRLSLHYFDDQTLARIFGEVHWVLRSGGHFQFVCKSTADSLYGQGIEVGVDMYELDGHIRHFISREYALNLLADTGFVDIYVKDGTDKVYGEPLAYVKGFGVKP